MKQSCMVKHSADDQHSAANLHSTEPATDNYVDCLLIHPDVPKPVQPRAI